MSKSTRQVFYYNVKPFNTSVIIVFDDTVEKALKFLVKECNADIGVNPKEEKLTNGIVGSGLDANGLNSYYMCFNKNTYDIGILAHECFHCIWKISAHKGMDLDRGSEEYYGYAIQDMVNEIEQKRLK